MTATQKMSFAVLVIAFTAPTAAQSKLEIWQEAKRQAEMQRGCDSIPMEYDTLKGQCMSVAKDLNEYCKEGRMSCDEVGRARDEAAAKGDPQAQSEFAKGNMRELDLRMGWNEKCRDARARIRDIFGDVIGQAKREMDPTITSERSALIRHWEQGQANHQKARDDAQAALDKCRYRLTSGDY